MDRNIKEAVFELLRSVPAGRVVTYGQLAQRLGNRHLARVVGNILHGNPDPTRFPCHRVVTSEGRVSKSFAFGGESAQRRLLEAEGIVFESNGRIDLARYGFML